MENELQRWPNKEAHEVIFSRKITKNIHPEKIFDNILVSKTDSQKLLGLYFDSKLSFDIHIKGILPKVSRNIGLLQKFEQVLPRPLKMYYHLKSF